MKLCTRCKTEKSEDEFGQRSGRRTGQLNSWCRVCRNHCKRLWALTNKEHCRRYATSQWQKDPAAWNAQRRAFRKKLRQQVVEKLGGRCAGVTCQWTNPDGSRGCTNPNCLQVDHVFNDGYVHRKQRGNSNGSTNKYLRSILNDTEGRFQLLCANCNLIKYNSGEKSEQK